MLRNFGILKILLFCPTRSDQYKAGPGEVMRTNKAINVIGTTNTKAAVEPNNKSNKRFKELIALSLRQLSLSLGQVSPVESTQEYNEFYQYLLEAIHIGVERDHLCLKKLLQALANLRGKVLGEQVSPSPVPCAEVTQWWIHPHHRKPKKFDLPQQDAPDKEL
jgi:hypothetical protein